VLRKRVFLVDVLEWYPNVETPLKDKGPEHVDFVVVRENTGGIYTGIGGVTQRAAPLEVATQVMSRA
jgi:3-isopropylmalate dehydrogenase